MAAIFGYVVIFIISVLIATLLLKFVIMKFTNFYSNINMVIYLIIIIGIFLFFMPKTIVSQSVYRQIDLSCKCTGFLYTSDYKGCMAILSNKDLLSKNPDIQKNGCNIQRDCFGVIGSCTRFESFKTKAIKDIELCKTSNEFYQSSDACFESAAREIASHAASGDPQFSFDSASAYCDKMTEPGKTQCANYIKILKSGGVLFG